MNREEQIQNLIHVFRRHEKWHSFYLKSIKEIITALNLPKHEIIECNLDEISLNEDFCIPLFISKKNHFFPSIKSAFKNSNQNQIIAVLNFDLNQFPLNLTIYYINQNELSSLESFNLEQN